MSQFKISSGYGGGKMKFQHKCCVCGLMLDVSEIAAVEDDLVFCEVCYDKAKLKADMDNEVI